MDEPPTEGAVLTRCIDYGPTRFESYEVPDLLAFLACDTPEWCTVRWINVDGLHPYVINRIREKYPFHTLAAEDILHVPQRAKLEAHDDHLFLVTRILMLGEEGLTDEQVSLVYFPDTVITFQERSGDVWDSVRKRIERQGSRLRESKAGYLLYALFDSVVDHVFPLLEHYGDRLEELEQRIADSPQEEALQALYAVKRELVMLRRVMWPVRQVADDLHRSEFRGIDKKTRPFLRDVYDHAIQVIDMIETYREMAGGLADLYMSSISNRMNEVMKVLTIIATLFIPITFIAGVYGMNFDHIPELGWEWSYGAFWLICATITSGLLVYFWRKGWIRRR